MKLQFLIKDPDGFSRGIQDAIAANVEENLEGTEYENYIETKTKEIIQSIKKYVKYEEYITIIIDTDADIAEVVRVQ